VGLLQQWGLAPALLGGDLVAQGFGAGVEGRGLALALLGGAPVAAGFDASIEGRGSSGSGAQSWRQRGSCDIGTEGGNDGAKGGGRKSGILMAQNQIFTTS
jgi:hypothetical protein